MDGTEGRRRLGITHGGLISNGTTRHVWTIISYCNYYYSDFEIDK